MVRNMRAGINQNLITLTTLPVLQSQTIRISTRNSETKIINLDAVISTRGVSLVGLSNPESHMMTLFSGRGWGVPSLVLRRRIWKTLRAGQDPAH